ncbi:acetylcholine receptor subunit beta-type unc-29-like [Pecten maximus]|uniref:acetylcholine receptor subunit beta-type unc-29-like n=1 Tax=Pecten maximus TaxID=6579 RepID=UPI0014584911|nr:acetylcholine receptor subunit beta-type unc-29-like [Pecten maximus]
MADSIISILPIHVLMLMGVLTTMASAESSMDRSRLHKSLLQEAYDTTVYPGSTDSPFQVSMDFRLTAFHDFDEKEGRFEVAGFLITKWNDERLVWDPSDFGQISSTQLPQSRVWTPSLVVWNTHARIRPFGFDTLPVRFNQSGDAVWEPGDVFETSCDAKISKFPFDVQTCTIDIFPYGNLENEINFTSTGIDQSNYEKNGVWDIVTISIFEVQGHAGNGGKVMIEIQFKRRSSYHIINILVPLIIMSLLNILAFIIPGDSSCRVDYAVTMLLTLSVFLTTVSDILPDSSLDEISYISVFVLVQILTSSLILACAIVSFSVGSHSKTSLRVLASVLKPFMGVVNVDGNEKQEVPPTGTDLESPDGGNDLAREGSGQSLETQIKDVSTVFDYVCIVLFSFEVVIVNLVFFVITNV